MRKITNQKYNLVNIELDIYENSWWYDGDDEYYYDDDMYADSYSYDELEPMQNIGYSVSRRGLSLYYPGPRYTPYKRIDMDSVYSKEVLRDKKIDRILGLSNNSNNNYKQPTLEDFFKSERIHR